MKKKTVRQVIFPLLTAMIWGSAFIAQSVGAGYLDAFAFNAARAVVGAAALLIVSVLKRKFTAAKEPIPWRTLLCGGLCCGVFLTLGSFLQQFGLTAHTFGTVSVAATSAGKAGFITALYVVLVPLLGLLFRKRVSPLLWVSVALAVGGLYFLCMTGEEAFTFSGGDLFVFLCAFAFAGQILCVDHFVQKVDGVMLSCAQFCVMAILCTVGTLCFETVEMTQLTACLPQILYVGIFSSGVAYTLQILAQKDGEATVVSLLISLESFFAVVFGALLLHEKLRPQEYLGCALMLLAVLLAQLPEKKSRK